MLRNTWIEVGNRLDICRSKMVVMLKSVEIATLQVFEKLNSFIWFFFFFIRTLNFYFIGVLSGTRFIMNESFLFMVWYIGPICNFFFQCGLVSPVPLPPVPGSGSGKPHRSNIQPLQSAPITGKCMNTLEWYFYFRATLGVKEVLQSSSKYSTSIFL